MLNQEPCDLELIIVTYFFIVYSHQHFCICIFAKYRLPDFWFDFIYTVELQEAEKPIVTIKDTMWVNAPLAPWTDYPISLTRHGLTKWIILSDDWTMIVWTMIVCMAIKVNDQGPR